MQKLSNSAHDYIQMIVGLLVLFAAAFALCLSYRSYQEDQFIELENKNLTANLQNDVQRTESSLNALQDRVRAAAEMISASDTGVDETWLSDYFDGIGRASNCKVIYAHENNISQWMSPVYFAQLKGENEVITPIVYSDKFDSYVFSFCVAVVRDGTVDSAIVCVLPAERLLGSASENIQSVEEQYIVDAEGTVVFASSEIDIGGNVINELRDRGVSEIDLEDCRHAFASDRGTTLSIGKGEGRRTVSSTPLSNFNYNLVRLARAGIISDVSGNLLRSTIITTAVLIVAVILACIMVFYLFAKKDRRARLEAEKFRTIAAHFDTLIFEYDTVHDHLSFTMSSSSGFEIITKQRDNCREQVYDQVHEDDQDAVRKMFAEAKSAPTVSAEFRLQSRDGSWVWCECRMEQLGTDERIRVGQIMSIEEQKQRELMLKKESSTDTLTGLLRIEAFNAEASELLDDRPGMFYFFDMNSLKKTNDTHGHEAGDKLLRMTANVVKRAFRASDPVARRSGDEFIAYAAGFGNVEMARTKADRIMAGVAAIDCFDGIRSSISVGVARYPQDGKTLEELSKAADEAMYVAKRVSGHSDYCCFFHEIEEIEKREG